MASKEQIMGMVVAYGDLTLELAHNHDKEFRYAIAGTEAPEEHQETYRSVVIFGTELMKRKRLLLEQIEQALEVYDGKIF